MQHKQSAKEWLLITQVKKLTISMLWTYHTQLLAALTFMFEFTISSKSSGLIFGTVFTSSINIRPTELSAGICPCCIQQTEAFHSPTAQFTAYTVHNLHEAMMYRVWLQNTSQDENCNFSEIAQYFIAKFSTIIVKGCQCWKKNT